jgi:deoxyadenosine/deoxycytidine kinase
MRVICLEGPSAAGKSSLSQALVAALGAVTVPEVNQLFSRPVHPESHWYLQRQQERWETACRSASRGVPAILDGDILQPLWYGWAYGFANHYSLSELVAFYRPLIANATLALPDTYFVLESSVEELRARKASDTTRTRRNFEHHLEFIEPQRRYFHALQALEPALVYWLPSSTVPTNTQAVQRVLASTNIRSRANDLAIFDQVSQFLEGSACHAEP